MTTADVSELDELPSCCLSNMARFDDQTRAR